MRSEDTNLKYIYGSSKEEREDIHSPAGCGTDSVQSVGNKVCVEEPFIGTAR